MTRLQIEVDTRERVTDDGSDKYIARWVSLVNSNFKTHLHHSRLEPAQHAHSNGRAGKILRQQKALAAMLG